MALPQIEDSDDIPQAFTDFVEQEKERAFERICTEEKLQPGKMRELLGEYLFTQIDPQPDAIINLLQEKPRILERKTILDRVLQRLKEFVETYISGVGE